MSPPELSTSSATTALLHDPLGDYPEQFQRHLESQHYKPSSVAQYGHRIHDLGRQMKAHGVELTDLDEDQAINLITPLDFPSSRRKYNAFIIGSFMRFLNVQGVTKPVLEAAPEETVRGRLRREYEEYLSRQRGLSDSTIRHCWWFADRFLRFRFNDAEVDFSQITPVDIRHGSCSHPNLSGKPLRDKTPPTHLRNLFSFLFKTGKIDTNLALSVPRIRQSYGARPPRYLATEQVETLLDAVRGVDTPTGRRNYAMVLLLARLGLRSHEVIAVQIDDINWRTGEILVRGKGEQHDRLPLPQDVGEAIAEYVRRDRVTASRCLFVAERAPHKPFADAQILNEVLKGAFAKTGLKPPAQYVGSHILRHSLATSLVQRGASLDEIGDMLRHRSRASTMIYAKVDVEGLRLIAHSWPTVGGSK